MPLTIPFSSFGHLSDEERDALIESAFAASEHGDAVFILVVQARLREYELRYEMESGSLSDALVRGVIRETREVSQWLFWFNLWSHIGGQARTEPAL